MLSALFSTLAMACQTRSKPFPFLNLPSEIREQVYTELLSSANNKIAIDDGKALYQFPVSIFRTSKQVHDESRAVFLRKNVFIRVEIPWSQAVEHVRDEGRVPMVCVGRHASNFTDYHMAAIIDASDPRLELPAEIKFIMCLDDLPAFCRMWFYSDLSHGSLNGHLRLTLRLRNPKSLSAEDALPKAVVRRLYEPFGLVKGLADVTFEGRREEDMEQMLRDAMAEAYESPESCLEKATKLKDEGNAALKATQYRHAIELYAQSFTAMHIVVNGRIRNVWADRYFEKELRGGPFDQKHGGFVRMVLRVQLVANTMLAYLKLDEFDEARFWGERSIQLMHEALGEHADHPRPEFPAADAWGKVYYRTAKACEGLGDKDEYKRLIRVAAAWLPHDKIVQQEAAAFALRLG